MFLSSTQVHTAQSKDLDPVSVLVEAENRSNTRAYQWCHIGAGEAEGDGATGGVGGVCAPAGSSRARGSQKSSSEPLPLHPNT